MKYLKQFKIFENFVDKTLYHGGLEGFYDEDTNKNMFNKFKQFKKGTAYFSDNPRFAVDYADRKTSEGGYDADIYLYTCKFKGNLFEYSNPDDMNKLIPLIPDEVEISHGVMWFMIAKIPKDEMIKALQAIDVVKPRKEFAEANIGDKVPNPTYKSELFMVVDKDENYVYTIDERNYNYYLNSSKKGYDKHFREHTKYRDIFEKWRNAIVDVYNENTGSKKRYQDSPYGDDESSDFYRVMVTYNYAKNNLKSIDYASYKNQYFILKQEQVDYIEGLYKEALEKFNEVAKKELHRMKWNIKTEERPMSDNWTYYECGVIEDAIKELGYDGYVALEEKHKTYAIYEPDKTVEIMEVERAR